MDKFCKQMMYRIQHPELVTRDMLEEARTHVERCIDCSRGPNKKTLNRILTTTRREKENDN